MDIDEIKQKILVKTYNFLSYRIRSKKEVIDKLDLYLQKFKDLDDSRKENIKLFVIDILIEQKFINDAAFAKTYADSSSKSMLQIKYFLLKKGISKDIIGDVLASLPKQQENTQITSLIKKRYPIYLKRHNKNVAKQKLINYLLSKGYKYSNIKTAFDTL